MEENRIAMIGIFVEDLAVTEQVNKILHQYASYVVGRMGIPYRENKINIISVVVDAPQSVISTISGKLGMLPGLSVKCMLSGKMEKNN
jgi:putative iron-only hydrogenase system regulator